MSSAPPAAKRDKRRPTPPRSDGRTRRREKSRTAIVEALFELVGEGVLMPTAQQVAARAGVGIRSVFRHFDDMEGLYAELDARLREEAKPLLRRVPTRGSMGERARALVEQRARLFERIAPYKRAANFQRWRSAFLRQQHAALVRDLRAALREALPELADAPPAVGDALDLLTSFEAWDRARTDQRLSRERTQEAVEQAVLGVLDGLAGPEKEFP